MLCAQVLFLADLTLRVSVATAHLLDSKKVRRFTSSFVRDPYCAVLL